MKTELVDVSEIKKQLAIEIPGEEVDAAIERVTHSYARSVKIPGFRPGKVPPRIVRQRFRDQILHDVAHELIPRAVDEALRERAIEPVDSPDIQDVAVKEGMPLSFTATFETVPALDPGDYATIHVRRPAVKVSDDHVAQALEHLRQGAARYEAVEDRNVETGDTVVVDLGRRALAGGTPGEADRHENVSVEIGASANPPGFDEQLLGLGIGARKTFVVHYPADYAIKDLAGTDVEYMVAVKALKRRVVAQLDDEFAKDLGEFETLEKLRARVSEDLFREAALEADRQVRSEVVKELARRVTVEVPTALVEREIDRRVEEFVRRLIDQQIDPRRATVDWEAFRKSQREAATDAVRGALMLDEVARREGLTITEADVTAEVERYAERSGRTPVAVRAQLEKEGGLGRLQAGLRRDRAVDFLLTRATIAEE
jgi:trigger factor